MEHESDEYTNCNWFSRYSHQRCSTGTGRRVETIQTTVLLRSARILKRVLETRKSLAVTQTPVGNHQLTLMSRVFANGLGD